MTNLAGYFGCSGGVRLAQALLAALVLTISLFVSSADAATQERKVPAGTPFAETIHFQYAIYYLPLPSKEPVKVLKDILHTRMMPFQLVAKMADAPKRPQLTAQLEKDVARNYSAPDMKMLQYFGRGLSRDQAQRLQLSRQALILNFGYRHDHVWQALRTANVMVEQVARRTSGLVWDEETREIFTPDEWHKRRVAPWTGTIPAISRHTTIHAYQDGEYVRAITLGMAKFGLPDVVVQDFSWSTSTKVGNLINAFCQAMAEGARFPSAGLYDLDIRTMHNADVNRRQNSSLLPNATQVARLTLLKGIGEEGDPRNRLIEIGFDRYPGKDVHARQDAMLDALYGWQDQIKRIRHSDELLAASSKARKQLPALQTAFAAGLQPGEFIELKAPFATPDGGNEWMWFEVTAWKGKRISGILKNEPFDIPDMHAGQQVSVDEDKVFDYLRRHPDGTEEGNETSKIIEKMQGKTEQSH